MPHRNRVQRSVAAVLTLVMIAGLVAWLPARTAEAQPGDGALSTTCSYRTARLLGWLWADGNYNQENDQFFFRSKNVRLIDHMRDVLAVDNMYYENGTSDSGHTNFLIRVPGYGDDFLYSDPSNSALVVCVIGCLPCISDRGRRFTRGPDF